jgi:abortive infection bacteriophage resistance protein
MSKIAYNKPALSYAEQLTQLKDRGLIIENEADFLDILEKKSYYRLSGYWYPLLSDKENHIFKPQSKFSTVYSIYSFDRDLRQLVIKELEKIEIAVRAKMIYNFSHQFGPFWYLDSSNFKDKRAHSETISKITIEFNRSDAQFVKSFRKKYSNKLPPSWTAFEIISFGSISKLYSIFNSGRSKREVADYFGLDDKTFISWLHGFVYVRNVCAHHSRLWNRVMRIQPTIPISPKRQWLNNTAIANNRCYFILSMILYLLDCLNEKNSLLDDFKYLLKKYSNIDPIAMGFPPNWKDETIWIK